MTMTSPTVLRRIAAAELIRHREAKGISQKDLDRTCDFNLGTISRYETCYSSMSAANARLIFSKLDVTGEALENLVEIARGSRKHSHGPISPDAPEWLQPLFTLERDATQVFDLNLNVVSGLLQTPAYARAIFKVGHHESSLDEMVEGRMSRKDVFKREPPMKLWAVTHESVFSKVVGSKQVMADQLDYLTEVAQTDHVTLQVIPNAIGAHVAVNNSFLLLRFNIAPQYGVVYVEQVRKSFFYDDPATVHDYDDVFKQVIMSALDKQPSIDLLRKIRKEQYS
ncbi:helix-turn-helix transcriptional regulator [Glycomyces sp. A-F 0318]|uniref:helix-turn-helix domain-containing protein n=1 Tax=Glycomyces amatae TaxID=2881355 RepID=UPI001E368F3D|nr:helix-turn-helix transcriptional regulator [Glycomyces amatae]MCD0446292.1 helix-turn-helix transcriptional regulator [Glycomyces amatae]